MSSTTPAAAPVVRKVAMLGAGSFGSAMARAISLALASSHPGATLAWYARRSSVADEINSSGTNSQYLPGGKFPTSVVSASTDAVACVMDADVVFLAVPTQFLPPVLDEVGHAFKRGVVICSVLKSLKYSGGKIVTSIDVAANRLGAEACRDVTFVVLSGPNLYSEMGGDVGDGYSFAEATIGYDRPADRDAASLVRSVTSGPSFRTSLSPDRRGLELCGGLKNVLSLAAGYLEGLGTGWNARAALIRAGMHEMARFMAEEVCGGGSESRTTVFETSGGVGDLMLTCAAGRGRTLAKAFVEMALREEGPAKSREESVGRWSSLEDDMLNGMRLPDWHNAQYVHDAMEDRGLLGGGRYPLLEAVYDVGFGGADPRVIVDALSRSIVVADNEGG